MTIFVTIDRTAIHRIVPPRPDLQIHHNGMLRTRDLLENPAELVVIRQLDSSVPGLLLNKKKEAGIVFLLRVSHQLSGEFFIQDKGVFPLFPEPVLFRQSLRLIVQTAAVQHDSLVLTGLLQKFDLTVQFAEVQRNAFLVFESQIEFAEGL
ncbi:hypothetical protein SDC9_179422 [bioreactor metagenome]|uniref:Uncharacterized protein n=1 Tax=bioreactor metagenome TaxID=1076179 RepID=A0A645GYW2_9ZZZZ